MAVLQPYKGGYYLWKYLPSVEAAAVACVLFAAATVVHSWRVWRMRAWFEIPFVVGGFMELVGYAARASAHNQTGKLMPFAIQNTMILLAPVLFAASIYMTLGRVIRAVDGERHSMIKLKWLTKLFVTGDIMSLVIQGSAAGLMVVSQFAKVAQGIVIAGLVIQIIIFGLFCLTTLLFHRRMYHDSAAAYIPTTLRWERALRMLYVVSTLIMVRSIFRVVEFAMGNDGYLLSTEWPVYIFDAVPMLFVMAIFWKWFPTTTKSDMQNPLDSMVSLDPTLGVADTMRRPGMDETAV